ncbi:phasin family protein [Marinospirillum alkaliphilum]|uniref:Phasin protein n=1 Tax=Marinospirillum alkaliphilum DSM 21637 TaxID=1122209 RepID=A0A1K1ZEP9_9GAMM|nr:phasin family protein [Marinospirillum alkaliphilum]SFX72738.1 Phasin protein [Marinospirillum alkaliphilum DSM 21637]
MFDKMFSDMQSMMKPYQESFNGKQFKPVANLMLIQAKTLEKMGSEQTRFYTECVEAVSKQFEAMGKNDPAALQEAQFNFAQDMQDRVSRLFKTSMDILAEARESANGEIESIKAQATAPVAKTKAA